MTIRRPKKLGAIDDIPADTLSRLQDHVLLLQRLEFSEQFEQHEPLLQLMRELDEICDSEGIVGVHYTRGDRGRLLAEGLIPRSGAERREEFLKTHGHRFNDAQRRRLVAGWKSYFDEEQNWVRDGRIWFNVTREAMSNGGAAPLLSHYGGEVVYMPFSRDEEIETVLSELGEPMIVECALQTDSVRTFCQNPWGRTWLSSFHRSVRPGAHQWDVDLYTQRPVPSHAILNVEVVG